jgi:SAM-dependent methyltransferase
VPRDWDRHYSDAAQLEQTPDPLLVEVAEMSPVGEALDLASGPGRNAIYLASLGWRVTAVDRSAVAIGILRGRAAGLPVAAHAADLERGEFRIAQGAYDLICDFYYLQRDLFPRIREGVRPGGLFVAAVHLVDPASTSGPHNPVFLLEPGELRREFADWKIAFYSEAPQPGRAQGAPRRAARIIARRT